MRGREREQMVAWAGLVGWTKKGMPLSPLAFLSATVVFSTGYSFYVILAYTILLISVQISCLSSKAPPSLLTPLSRAGRNRGRTPAHKRGRCLLCRTSATSPRALASRPDRNQQSHNRALRVEVPTIHTHTRRHTARPRRTPCPRDFQNAPRRRTVCARAAAPRRREPTRRWLAPTQTARLPVALNLQAHPAAAAGTHSRQHGAP